MAPTQADHANELSELLDAAQNLIVPFVANADASTTAKQHGKSPQYDGVRGRRTALVETLSPEELSPLLIEGFVKDGKGKEGLVEIGKKVLDYSVNTWDQGFLDKLYGNTDAIGVAADMLLTTLNTNVHVYQVSPALTVIERHTARFLASLFHLTGPNAGGISVPGGSFANLTALILARNTLHPRTLTHGLGGYPPLVAFTSAHGHYSLQKAAQISGIGTANVVSVPVDASGRMSAASLASLVAQSKAEGKMPFFVNATAGTTVFGAYDPLEEIAEICKREGCWMHVDASWGGGVAFAPPLAWEDEVVRLKGAERADSVGVCLHKMLAVPVTCSMLLGKDLRQFAQGMGVDAGYLFHGESSSNNAGSGTGMSNGTTEQEKETLFWDLGQLTPACGRRGEALKLYLSLQYHGLGYYNDTLTQAFGNAAHLDNLLHKHPHVIAVSPQPLPCLQVCFYWARDGKLSENEEEVSRSTESIVRGLVDWGWMTDFAPGERGKFLRLVVGMRTKRETVEGFVKALEGVAEELRL